MDDEDEGWVEEDVDGAELPDTEDCECCDELAEYNVNMPGSNCGEDE